MCIERDIMDVAKVHGNRDLSNPTAQEICEKHPINHVDRIFMDRRRPGNWHAV